MCLREVANGIVEAIQEGVTYDHDGLLDEYDSCFSVDLSANHEQVPVTSGGKGTRLSSADGDLKIRSMNRIKPHLGALKGVATDLLADLEGDSVAKEGARHRIGGHGRSWVSAV